MSANFIELNGRFKVPFSEMHTFESKLKDKVVKYLEETYELGEFEEDEFEEYIEQIEDEFEVPLGMMLEDSCGFDCDEVKIESDDDYFIYTLLHSLSEYLEVEAIDINKKGEFFEVSYIESWGAFASLSDYLKEEFSKQYPEVIFEIFCLTCYELGENYIYKMSYDGNEFLDKDSGLTNTIFGINLCDIDVSCPRCGHSKMKINFDRLVCPKCKEAYNEKDEIWKTCRESGIVEAKTIESLYYNRCAQESEIIRKYNYDLIVAAE